MNSYYPMSKLKQLQEWKGKWNMIKLEDIKILRVVYRTLDNVDCCVDIEWTAPEMKPSWQSGLYSLPRDEYDVLCKSEKILINWCKQTIYQNEIRRKKMSKIINLAQQVERFYTIRIDTILPHTDGFTASLLDGQIKIITNLFPGTKKHWIIIQSTSTINKRHTIKYEDIAEDTFDLYKILETHRKLHNIVANKHNGFGFTKL